MLSRIFTWIVAVPFGVVVVALAVANRKPVTLSFDPFRADDPAFAVAVPLFALILGTLIVGIVLGGLLTWWRQRVHRRAARDHRREVARLADQRDRLAADLAARSELPPTGLTLPVPAGPRRAA